MGFDRNGQLHAGAIGLFDDPDEVDTAADRRLHALEKQERKIDKLIQKENERGQKKAEKTNRKRLDKQRGLSWYGRLFGGKKNERKDEQPPTSGVWVHPAVPLKVNDKEREEVEALKKSRKKLEIFDEKHVDYNLDSPFYEELGLVLVRGETTADDRVVHKSQIRPASINSDDEDADDPNEW
ncbi:hypothetical protein K458DRAFT_389424 [Lentithecium fluviatile CBS 122367]|uniref:Uncharacterized protein n=1 Tax=Lentithecium fluviatile CBS 122367 TaxID=1168545 RepID=A0A6G1J248_9PLEO|nr:hypothetical protein K458DRAFT_389424 [Lentithecium fluviatile CBS 122367]